MTFSEALTLRYGQIVYHVSNKNADGTPQRWRISGKVQTWKRTPSRIRIPVKHGMYDNDAIDENSLHLVVLTEDQAK